MTELRAYFFCNMYLTGIHAAIQSQHATVEMFLKYQSTYANFVEAQNKMLQGWDIVQNRSKEQHMLFDWANNHKTTIVVNGGKSGDLNGILELLQRVEVYGGGYPFAYFKETEEALNGALTNVGVILSERIFNFVKDRNKYEAMSTEHTHDLTEIEIELAERVAKCKLMN